MLEHQVSGGPRWWRSRLPLRVIFDRFSGRRGPVDVRFAPKAPKPSQGQERRVWPNPCDSNSQTGARIIRYMLLADRGYDADWIRELAMKKGAWANLPPKSDRTDPICSSPYLPRSQPGRAVLQQDQTMPSGGDALR